MQKLEKIQLIHDTGIIAIMRANSSDQLIAAADAIRLGGVRVIEVTMTTPGALQVLEKAAIRFGDDVLFGAGSVLDSETARQAILSGADFIVAPILDIQTIDICHRYSIPVIPGCFTPSEILAAWNAGADIVKVFPSDIGGPKYIKAIHGPLPNIDLIPVGGVTILTTADYILAGSFAVGVGSDLINQHVLEKSNMTEMTQNALAFIGEVEKGRKNLNLQK
ncbi:MAG: bifunctional 4-hydroxy-2-oxoglutarate aldolase/2-dehydro-3-deoxy-phosphogluconate aldolase [Clostridiaceae bacterium]|nr:bifunctional 4-hydroxy-2-oxoglutarate aldolase/2-dehydro-3-deoxy-phosphogluconate aldolase [Clostridiaceae bacterium]